MYNFATITEKPCFVKLVFKKFLIIFRLVQIFVLYLQSNQNIIFMNNKTKTLELTEKEFDLIQAIRNYRKSYIFSGADIVYHIEKLFTELMEGEE